MKLQSDFREEAKLADARKSAGYRATLDAIAKLEPGKEYAYHTLPPHEIVISLWPSGAFAAVRDAHAQGTVTPLQRRVGNKLLYLARRK